MKNIKSIIGLILIVLAAFGGYFLGFSEGWLLQVVAASAGLALAIAGELKKKEKKNWKVYLTAFVLSIGTILAIFGGETESIITTVIGAVILIAGIAYRALTIPDKA